MSEMAVAAMTLQASIERKHSKLPAFVVLPAERLAKWKLAGTTTIEGTLDGVPLGRRSLKRWDEARWFLELPQPLLDAVGKSEGDRVALVLSIASTALPAELAALIDTVPAARESWEARTDAQRRMLREEILGAKTAATRDKRARQALLPVAAPRAPAVRGLPSTPQAITVRIVGTRLPGRTCGPYTEVSVGLPLKTGCDPATVVRADVRQATWETRVEISGKDGAPAFRGPAVNGPPHERFLYLTWFGREAGAALTMFRRAKLRLDAVPAGVLKEALGTGLLVGRVGLTDATGMPLCASVRPPTIAWAADSARPSRT
jgi:Family of unknown function (DUF5990)/Bacteriocin-protection, YdeI or OmpD-Associated/Domain of unknown function (DUF1905)